MEAGNRINADLGELILLDIEDDYLILFEDETGKFTKANGYDKDGKISKVFVK